MNTTTPTRDHIGKQLITLLICFVVTAIAAGCGGGGASSGSAESAITKYFNDKGQPVKSVTFIGKPQVYDDSFRSPGDMGTTTKGNVKVEFSDGKTEQHEFRVFVAKKDGWTNVKQGE